MDVRANCLEALLVYVDYIKDQKTCPFRNRDIEIHVSFKPNHIHCELIVLIRIRVTDERIVMRLSP